MPDLTLLYANPLWRTACVFARQMHFIAESLSPKSGQGLLGKRIENAALRLPATIADMHEDSSGRTRDLHLTLANARTIELEQCLAEIRLGGLVGLEVILAAEQASRPLHEAFSLAANIPQKDIAKSA